MLRAPIWITSATSTTSLDVAHVHQLGDHRAGRSPPWPPGAGAGPRRRGPGSCTGRCGACRRRRGASWPRHRRPTRATSSVCSRLSTVHGPGDQPEVLAADLAAVDLDHRPLALAELGRGQLVGLEDRHQVVDARRSPRAPAPRPARGRRSRRSRSAPRPERREPSTPPPRLARRRRAICSSVAPSFITIIIFGCSPKLSSCVRETS